MGSSIGRAKRSPIDTPTRQIRTSLNERSGQDDGHKLQTYDCNTRDARGRVMGAYSGAMVE
jgi:hypothetical protein